MGLDKFVTVYIFIKLIEACQSFDEFCRVWQLNNSLEFKVEVYKLLTEEAKDKYKPWFSEAKRIYCEFGDF